MLTLFYSLAIHMYFRLGGWPKSIGDDGYGAGIAAADIAVYGLARFIELDARRYASGLDTEHASRFPKTLSLHAFRFFEPAAPPILKPTISR